MKMSWRWGLRGVLLVIAVALLWYRLMPHRTAPSPPPAPTIPGVASGSDLNQPGGGPAPADAYPVYAGLYQTPLDEPVAIASRSVVDIPQVGGSCLKPSNADEREMTDAFTAANRQSHTWQPKFSVNGGYKLLDNQQAAQAQSCLEHHDTSGECAQWKGIRHLRFLGVPGFNQAHTRALVSVIKMCGNFCGSGGIFAVEKDGDTWKRSETTDFTRDCSWMY